VEQVALNRHVSSEGSIVSQNFRVKAFFFQLPVNDRDRAILQADASPTNWTTGFLLNGVG
jgi:hypothetical protein